MVFTLVLALGELLAAEPRTRAVGPEAAPLVEPSLVSPVTLAPIDPLRNPRTGVTCTMRVLKAEPVDPRAVRPAPEASVDPDIRGHISPCLE
jgi:hypothetical protein